MQVKLRFAPIVRMSVVVVIVAAIIVSIYAALQSFPNFEAIMRDSSWIISNLVHIPQFLIPFILICWLTKGRLGEYGFNLKQKPPVFTHKRMLGLGVLFGLLMSLKYVSSVVKGAPLDIPRPVSLANVLGSLAFQWIVVGLSEETMFRGLVQTYLMNNLKGHVMLLGHDLHVGTVVGAILWGVFHFINILVMPLGSVVFFVVVTTVAGLLMGYAYQETGSLLTTIIVHNTIFGVPLTIGYILYWLA
ncbi:MAG: CPBP family intramembrane metalloprotease [Anaerolineae bacterium]|nr:CPBP family intramembrane metalloprotease [Anaerolineae bacterium]